MKKNAMIKMVLAAAVLLAAFGLAASAAGPSPAQADKAVVLEYKMPQGQTLTYKNTEQSGQVMDVMGQTVDTTTTGGGTFTLKAKGLKDKNFLLGITIDDMSSTISGPQGDMSPDMTPVKGKSFDMVLSPLGSEVDVSGAEAITYTSPNGTGNVSAGFKLFFPDLPGKPVKVGDTWESSGGADDKSENMNIRMDFKNLNTFDGLETVNGMECARIKSAVTATISGTGNQQGMDMAISGTGKGTDVWYFAIKDGLYVKATSDLSMEMAVTVSAANMTIPVTQTRKSEVTLVTKQ
ncbi:MAG TPA: hypothetical protein VLJ16_02885 [Acidobacteriota bacterium]|nr:hypothetical protein [Acidobacteriota bacterium]